MSAIANMTIADGAATPVNHTFTAKGVLNGVAKWKDQVTGVELGMPTITASIRESTKTNPMTKVTIKFRLPALETDPSFLVPTLAYEDSATIEFLTHTRDTLQNRDDLQTFVYNMLNQASMIALVKDREVIW